MGLASFEEYFRRIETKQAKSNRKKIYLTLEEFKKLVTQDCFYCGAPPRKRILWKNKFIIAQGLDRINSNYDYYLWNTVPCCSKCNYMKRNMEFFDFILQVEKIYETSKNICTRSDLDHSV